ncbi:unnamed protein product [Moneuplotes crassus]|uniref:Uncharacterized protein n=1 Tax=Euplotes crassus TaxID=5936 RepID=A0AAD1XWM9_EUPCR|nr:unnamed protein product [Moneuplotes crassus]
MGSNCCCPDGNKESKGFRHCFGGFDQTLPIQKLSQDNKKLILNAEEEILIAETLSRLNLEESSKRLSIDSVTINDLFSVSSSNESGSSRLILLKSNLSGNEEKLQGSKPEVVKTVKSERHSLSDSVNSQF